MSYRPFPENVRPRANLTNFGVSWAQSKDGAGLLLPGIVPVKRKRDQFRVWDKGDLTRLAMTKRAPASLAAKAEFGVSSTNFDCERRALEVSLPDEYESDYESRQDAERPRIQYLVEQAYLRLSVDFGAAVMTSGVWTNTATLAGASQWNDATSNPIDEIKRRNREMRERGLRRGNILYLGPKVSDDLAEHPDIIARVQYGGTNSMPARASLQAMAELFEVDQVVRLDASRNTADKGATATMSSVFGRLALLAFLPNTMTTEDPAAFKIFSFREFDNYEGAAIGAPLIYRYWRDDLKAWFLGSELFYDIQITADDAAFLWVDAVAA